VKVLFLTWEFPPRITGGLGTACWGMVRGLLELGVEIFLVLPDSEPCGFYLKRPEDIDLPIHAMDVHEAGRKREGGPYRSDPLSNVRYRELVESVIVSLDFDIVHAHDWLTYEGGLHAKEAAGKPLVCHVHSTEFDRSCGRQDERIEEYERIGLSLADRVVAVSRFTAEAIRSRYGVAPEKIRVVHNGFLLEDTPSPAARPSDEPVVLFMGRMTCQKGPDIFLEVARGVLGRFPGVRFIMAGEGDMTERLMRRVSRYGIKDRVTFTGFLEREDVARVLSTSDVLVAPSVSDPFNITVLEAMSRGLAVLVSRQSGVIEAVRHVLTEDYWNVDGMIRRVVSLLKDPEEMTHLGRLGKAEVRGISWRDRAFELTEVYAELLDFPVIPRTG